MTAVSACVDRNKVTFLFKRMFYGIDGMVVILMRKPGEVSFTAEAYDKGCRIKRDVKGFALAEEAADGMEQMSRKLARAGFAEL